MKATNLVRATLGSIPALALALPLAVLAQNAAPPVESLARDAKTRATQRPLLASFAAQHPRDLDGALALLALGGLDNLKSAQPRLPKINDYVLYLLADAQFAAQDFAAASQSIDALLKQHPQSPVLPRALLIAAKSRAKLDPASVIPFVETHRARIAQPTGDMLLAQAAEQNSDSARALAAYRRVYLTYPKSVDALEAERALRRLAGAAALAPTADLLARANLLIDTGEPARGARDLELLLPALEGRERDLARLRIGAARYAARDNVAAYTWLKALSFSDPGLEGQRLFHLINTSRRLEKAGEVESLLEDFRQRLPQSPWRLEALASAGTFFYNGNQFSEADTVFSTCAATFTAGDKAPYCHWKSAFADHLKRRPNAAARFEEHYTRFPSSPHSSAALYFRGRLFEQARDTASAKALYQRADQVFPNHYYAVLSRGRLKELAAVTPSNALTAQLNAIAWPKINAPSDYDPSPASLIHIERADLLARAAHDDLADLELRSAQTGQPQVIAFHIAQLAQRRGEPNRGIRWVKNLFPAYFSIPLESAPFRFWQMAYPLPWRSSLERHAAQYAIDPFLLAGLIRQESEFDTNAVSRSNARGLTQVMPATGRWLSPKVGLRGFTTAMLHTADANLRLGSFYLRMMLDTLDSNLEFTLAAYNAGKGRVDKWRTWFDYREPAEFVESIPFEETRNYVQVVIRNADFYRRLYSSRPAASTPTPAPTPVAAVSSKDVHPRRQVLGSARGTRPPARTLPRPANR